MATADQLIKAAETTRIANEIIMSEAEARRKKSEKLREARIAAEKARKKSA